jgi:hypothetical protein
LGLQDVDSDRIPFKSASGELVGVAQIEDEENNTLVLLIAMKDKDGYYALLPVLVNFNEDFTLPKGTKCLPPNTNDGPIYTLPEDLTLGPLVGSNRGAIITKDDIYKNIGQMVGVQRYVQSFMMNGIPLVSCFYPDLNLEMAGSIGWSLGYEGISSPWLEK